MLAFSLQLLAPLLDFGAVAAGLGEAGLQADLQSSLCHDPGAGQPDGGSPAPSSVQTKHCVFCLPMAGDHATTGPEIGLRLPTRAAPVSMVAVADQVRDLSRPAFARSRAPPASPRTA
ncbi:MAG: hypothetical protein HY055_16320 [Magnetospirillum sp.]|nr:hypothetical protein [Magnetospirillum sp.]